MKGSCEEARRVKAGNIQGQFRDMRFSDNHSNRSVCLLFRTELSKNSLSMIMCMSTEQLVVSDILQNN